MKTDPIPYCETCNQDDATGFIKLNALRLKVATKVQKEKIDWRAKRVPLCGIAAKVQKKK
ncbi:MAG TPA: hypothetical protein VJT54_08275 [Verrucomicrobiae bacterium]|nr:hypothetical protein [Verrucomicrobiae bacterium]